MAGGDTKTAAHYKFLWLLCVQVLEGMLEGASHLRSVLRVMGNLLSTRCDAELLDHFCRELNVPLSLLCLAKHILESDVTKQVGVEPQRNMGTFQPCKVLVLRMPWCPAGSGSQAPLLGTLEKGNVLVGKDPVVVVWGWPTDNPHLWFLSGFCSSLGVLLC